MKKVLITLSQSTFFWNVLNWSISVVTTELSWVSWAYAPVILAILSLITKELNKNYNPYYLK